MLITQANINKNVCSVLGRWATRPESVGMSRLDHRPRLSTTDMLPHDHMTTRIKDHNVRA